jgi:hypothetical protein
MKKVKYLIQRIKSINYKQFFNYLSIIKERSHKNIVYIFFDVILCGIIYQAGYIDYNLFEMYNMSSKERKTVVTRGINDRFVRFFNNPEYKNVFFHKDQFNHKFNDFLNRKWLLLSDDYDAFIDFIKDQSVIIAKPIAGSCGRGIEKINVKDYELNDLYNYLKSKDLLLLEEIIIQNEILSGLYPHAINTIRMITISKNNKSTILAAYLRIGNEGRFVDNFNSGGMVVPINITNGLIEYPALDKRSILYEKHPMTNTTIKGLQIPSWNEIVAFGEGLALVMPEMGMIGWDISLSNKGPLIVEGNEYPGHDIYQLPPHRTNNIGMLPQFEQALNRIDLKLKDVI